MKSTKLGLAKDDWNDRVVIKIIAVFLSKK